MTMNGTSQKHPLRWFLVIWLALVYMQGLLEGGSGPRIPGRGLIWTGINPARFALVVFTVLMALHCGLHLVALFRKIPARLLIPYFLVQGMLVLIILYAADAQDAVFGLCLALTLEAIHLLKWTHSLLVIVGGYLALYILALGPASYFVGTDALSLLHKLVSSLILLMFIIACVILYRQQALAHRRDQELLHELEATHAQLASTHTQLEAAHMQLEDYAARVEALTLLAERQRLARELHDTLAQGLVGLTMQLETVNGLLVRERGPQAREVVQQAMSRARATLADARRVIDDLRAETPARLNFYEAVQEEIARFTTATAISCCSQLDALVLLPPPFHEHALRVIREGLTNIARHAQASQVGIDARQEEDALVIEIQDNGTGFDPENVTALNGHYGLLGLRERARLINGELELVSAPAQGTLLRFSFPLKEKSQEQRDDAAAGQVVARVVQETIYNG